MCLENKDLGNGDPKTLRFLDPRNLKMKTPKYFFPYVTIPVIISDN